MTDMGEVVINKKSMNRPNVEKRRPIRCIETGRVWEKTLDWLEEMRSVYNVSYRTSRRALAHDEDIAGYHYERVPEEKRPSVFDRP